MPHPDVTAVLREEHRRILEIVAVLERALDASVDEALAFERIDRCVRFLRLYADACHHGKEEDELFPVLAEQGIPLDTGPVAALIEEHREGRRLLAILRDALPYARAGGARDRERLVEAGRDYIDLIRSHIEKEDEGVFQMADLIVPAPACARLCAAYERAGSVLFEGCTKARLEELAAEILAPGR